jgi:hypothetical protein
LPFPYQIGKEKYLKVLFTVFFDKTTFHTNIQETGQPLAQTPT